LWKDNGLVWSSPAVDWGQRHELVRKVFNAHFAEKCVRAGLDPEEVLQDVCLALVRYNESNPWDHTRGALSTYIYKVCRSKCDHAKDKARRLAAHERPGVREDAASWCGAEGLTTSVSGAELYEAAQELQQALETLEGPWHPQLPKALVDGWSDKQIRRRLGLTARQLREQREALHWVLRN
jgi:hypothetical protein